MTTAIMPLLLSIAYLNFFGTGGLVEVMDGVFLGLIIKAPVKFVVRTAKLAYTNWSEIEEVRKSGTQHELNELNKTDDWDISSNYAGFITNFAVTLFFLPIMPYCIFYTMIGLLLQHFLEKVRSKERISIQSASLLFLV